MDRTRGGTIDKKQPMHIDDLDLTEEQKKQVLRLIAWHLWHIYQESNPDGPDYHCKSYDPLDFWEDQVHSYVFDMEDGGRHHNYKNLQHVECMIIAETIEKLKQDFTYLLEDEGREG